MDAAAAPSVTARLYRDGDEDAVLSLLRAAFGSWPLEPGLETASREFFRWKHFAGPWGPSTLYVAEADGRIVGFRGYMPWRLAARDRILRASQVVDAATDPAVQAKGVFNVISIRAVEQHFVRLRERPDEANELSFGTPNALSRRAAERPRGKAATVSSLVVGTFGFSVRFRRARMLRRRLRIGGSRRPIAAERAADVLDDAGAVAAFVEEAQSADARIATARTIDYLRWRYPPFLGYHAVSAPGNGRLKGLAIFRERDAGYGYTDARVVELLVEPGDRQAARDLLARVARSTSAEWITCCFAPDSDAKVAADSAGFEPQPHKMSLIVTRFSEHIEPDPYELASWALTLGDVEELI
jgi:Acetyltransferase (GNAT) domain